MTDQEIQQRRNTEFQIALENLINRYGLDLQAPYSHNVDGLQIGGNARIQLNPRPSWQPPADWTNPSDPVQPTPNGSGKVGDTQSSAQADNSIGSSTEGKKA